MAITRTTPKFVAGAEVDDEGLVAVTVTEPLTIAEARTLAAEILAAADDAHAYEAEKPTRPSWAETVHGMPVTGYSHTSCCGLSPFELPAADRLTATPAAVTCSGKGTEQ